MRQIAKTTNVDRLNHVVRLISTGHGIRDLSNILKLAENAVYPYIRRHAFYIVASLPTAKYATLKTMIEKDRDDEDIALLLSLPMTLVSSAKRLYADNDYPPAKQLSS